MKNNTVREIAKSHGIKVGGMKKHELVRLIQETEGNRPCFNSNHAVECGQHDCLWREDCA